MFLLLETNLNTPLSIDHHHPFYLQACDTAGNNLICFSLTSLENYAIWSRSMKIGLVGNSKLGFVDGRYTNDKCVNPLHELWKRCNAIVLSPEMISVCKELLGGIIYASSARSFG